MQLSQTVIKKSRYDQSLMGIIRMSAGEDYDRDMPSAPPSAGIMITSGMLCTILAVVILALTGQ